MNKIKINLGDRECDTSVRKRHNETMYDELWYGEDGSICKKCKDKEYMWRITKGDLSNPLIVKDDHSK